LIFNLFSRTVQVASEDYVSVDEWFFGGEEGTQRATGIVVLDENLDIAGAKERIKYAYLTLCYDRSYGFERDGYCVRRTERL